MRITWGAELDAGSVRWSVDAPLSEFSFISLRIGQSYDPSVPSAVDSKLICPKCHIPRLSVDSAIFEALVSICRSPATLEAFCIPRAVVANARNISANAVFYA